MVNNRPVYNYFAGGTFWETLPIGINDVEQIEVVRGASTPMFGPNAVLGVINIITRDYSSTDGFHTTASIQGGTQNSLMGNINIANNFGNGLSVGLTSNYGIRDRYTNLYYSFVSESNVPLDEVDPNTVIVDADQAYPNPELAQEQLGVNAFIDYKKDKVAISANVGYQDSEVQKIYVDTGFTPLTTNRSDTRHVDLKASVGELSIQASVLGGEQFVVDNASFEYEFQAYDAMAEYNFTFGKLSIRPGINFRQAIYDGAFINGENSISTVAGSVFADYALSDKWRIVAALRGDQYSTPDRTELSYQGAITFKPFKSLLLRGGLGKANRAPFMIDSFLDIVVNRPGRRIEFTGNDDLDLMGVNSYEFGARYQPKENLILDLEAYAIRTKNYSGVLGPFTSVEDGIAVSQSRYENFDVSVQQFGSTLELKYVMSEKLQARGFVSLQTSRIMDRLVSIDNDGNTVLEDKDNDSTPTAYGGILLTYIPTPKLCIGLNTYFYGEQVFINIRGTDNIDSKTLLNARVCYAITKNIDAFVIGRNILDDRDREFAFGNEIHRTIIAGVKLGF